MIYLAFALIVIAQIAGSIYLLMHGHPLAGGFLLTSGMLFAGSIRISRKRG